MRRTTGAVLGLLLAALASGCSTGTTGGPPDTGHGNPEDVVNALVERGVECTDLREVPATDAESAATCQVGDAQVSVVHFEEPAQRERHDATCRDDLALRCVSTDAWGLSSTGDDVVHEVAAALEVAESG